MVTRSDVKDDPIVKFKQVIRIVKKEDGKEEDCSYAYAFRESGLIDLYWNYNLTSSPEGKLNLFLETLITLRKSSAKFTYRYISGRRTDIFEFLLKKELYRVGPGYRQRHRSYKAISYSSQQ